MKKEITHRRLVVGMSLVFSRGQASIKEKQDVMNKLNVNIITESSIILKDAFEYFKSLQLSLESFKKENYDNSITTNNN